MSSPRPSQARGSLLLRGDLRALAAVTRRFDVECRGEICDVTVTEPEHGDFEALDAAIASASIPPRTRQAVLHHAVDL
jgi:hypothetical protein